MGSNGWRACARERVGLGRSTMRSPILFLCPIHDAVHPPAHSPTSIVVSPFGSTLRLVSLTFTHLAFELTSKPPPSPPATKVGAIVAGQTSVKAPERAAFEAHLPPDVHIVSCHSLHGPTVSPLGQPLVGAPARFARCKPKVSWLSSRSSSSIDHLNGRSGWWRTYCARYDRATSICPTRTMTSSLRTHKQ